ncbi:MULTISPECIES: hypothetical protein [Nostoc]|uniref:BioF2-like acetyltransferase domain-containing protein n=1 Tax=Nostoc paludosum FACHB-159 TaxID=2692908 RepID=A0ABR8KPW3_9NOSO|nr:MULTISPECIES: hypothetical protein [Nostoc]MBD2683571.1 hypothetical protein [Nostoc sp. FACHB-857]MBD2739890.1 hypothetical protein [Nostoc paludosum FACHB-159]
MSTSNYPLYIERGGEQVLKPPFNFENASIHSFLLQAENDKLQFLCDRYLNKFTEDKLEYRPAMPYVFLVVTDVEKVYSLNQKDREMGWMPEIDVSFWILTIAMKRVAGVMIPDRLVWFMPYLFVDSGYAMAGGREIYGYHKMIGQFNIPKLTENAALIKVDTIAFEHFHPDAKAKMQCLFEVRRIDGEINNPHVKDWHSIDEASAQLNQMLAHRQGGITGALIESLSSLLKVFSLQTVPVAFLKQFRDVTDYRRACYQAIVEADAKVTHFRAGGVLQGQYELMLNNFDSHPIAQELGLKVGKQRVLDAFWFNYDFIMEAGTEILKASTLDIGEAKKYTVTKSILHRICNFFR